MHCSPASMPLPWYLVHLCSSPQIYTFSLCHHGPIFQFLSYWSNGQYPTYPSEAISTVDMVQCIAKTPYPHSPPNTKNHSRRAAEFHPIWRLILMQVHTDTCHQTFLVASNRLPAIHRIRHRYPADPSTLHSTHDNSKWNLNSFLPILCHQHRQNSQPLTIPVCHGRMNNLLQCGTEFRLLAQLKVNNFSFRWVHHVSNNRLALTCA